MLNAKITLKNVYCLFCCIFCPLSFAVGRVAHDHRGRESAVVFLLLCFLGLTGEEIAKPQIEIWQFFFFISLIFVLEIAL